MTEKEVDELMTKRLYTFYRMAGGGVMLYTKTTKSGITYLVFVIPYREEFKFCYCKENGMIMTSYTGRIKKSSHFKDERDRFLGLVKSIKES